MRSFWVSGQKGSGGLLLHDHPVPLLVIRWCRFIQLLNLLQLPLILAERPARSRSCCSVDNGRGGGRCSGSAGGVEVTQALVLDNYLTCNAGTVAIHLVAVLGFPSKGLCIGVTPQRAFRFGNTLGLLDSNHRGCTVGGGRAFCSLQRQTEAIYSICLCAVSVAMVCTLATGHDDYSFNST